MTANNSSEKQTFEEIEKKELVVKAMPCLLSSTTESEKAFNFFLSHKHFSSSNNIFLMTDCKCKHFFHQIRENYSKYLTRIFYPCRQNITRRMSSFGNLGKW
jgi:uncharacterized protein (DUF2344 family)